MLSRHPQPKRRAGRFNRQCSFPRDLRDPSLKPDPPATFDDLFNGNFGWLALNSLVEFGEEIADICEDPFFGYNPVTLNGKSYEIQPEYSNKFHTCAFVP